jgi:hypothetical protein
MRRIFTVTALITALSVSACSGDEPAQPAAAPPSTSPSALAAAPSSTAPADRDGELACYTLSRALPEGSIDALIDHPGTVDLVVKAAADSTNPAIREVGPALADRAGRAAALVGTDQAEDAAEALRGTVERFKTACVDANLGYW